MRLRHFASLGFAVLLSGASPATVPVASAGTSGASSSAIGFQVPTVVDPIHTNGEPDVAIDPQGRVFVSGPTGTGTQRSTWFGSVDGGQTPLIYLEFNNVVGPGPNGGAQWNKSTDGLAFVNGTGDEVPATGSIGAVYSPFGPDGYPAIDQVTGKVFQAAGCRISNGCTANGIFLNIGTPDATGTLHFLDATGTGQDLTKLIKIADTPNGSPDTLFSVLSIDSARNLILVWCISSNTPSQRQVFVSAASAASGWTSWTTPVQVSDGSTGTGDAVNVFPWIKAGGPGRADAVWYGQDKNVDPSSQSGQAW